MSEYIKTEATTVDREGARDLGFGALALLSSDATATTGLDLSKGVFDGLTATVGVAVSAATQRRSCTFHLTTGSSPSLVSCVRLLSLPVCPILSSSVFPF